MSNAAEPLVVSIGLSAAIVSVADEEPCVLAVRATSERDDALPFGPFDPLHHRTLESGLRTWVMPSSSTHSVTVVAICWSPARVLASCRWDISP